MWGHEDDAGYGTKVGEGAELPSARRRQTIKSDPIRSNACFMKCIFYGGQHHSIVSHVRREGEEWGGGG